MTKQNVRSQRRRQRPRARVDLGFTLVELVVTIVLVALAAGSVLAAVGVSIKGSSRHRDTSTAMAWLQSSIDYLEVAPMEVCGTPGSVATAYEEDIRAHVSNSRGWDSTAISVSDVKFWNGTTFDAACGSGLQLVSLAAQSPGDDVTERLDVVKGDPSTTLSVAPPASDSASTCQMAGWSWTSSTTGAVSTAAGVTTLALKRPSLTKPSSVTGARITVTMTTTGGCVGKLRMRYQYPHNDHSHSRTIKLELVAGTSGTYVGKLGHGGDRYYSGAAIDITVEQGRAKSKKWGTIVNGQQDDKVRFG